MVLYFYCTNFQRRITPLYHAIIVVHVTNSPVKYEICHDEKPAAAAACSADLTHIATHRSFEFCVAKSMQYQ